MQFGTGRCPKPQLPFLTAKKGNPKKATPTNLSPSGPVCSGRHAEFWELALLRQPKILNASLRSQP